jgi:hypothetical protein
MQLSPIGGCDQWDCASGTVARKTATLVRITIGPREGPLTLTRVFR